MSDANKYVSLTTELLAALSKIEDVPDESIAEEPGIPGYRRKNVHGTGVAAYEIQCQFRVL